jgi:hypothetical protein
MTWIARGRSYHRVRLGGHDRGASINRVCSNGASGFGRGARRHHQARIGAPLPAAERLSRFLPAPVTIGSR